MPSDAADGLDNVLREEEAEQLRTLSRNKRSPLLDISKRGMRKQLVPKMRPPLTESNAAHARVPEIQGPRYCFEYSIATLDKGMRAFLQQPDSRFPAVLLEEASTDMWTMVYTIAAVVNGKVYVTLLFTTATSPNLRELDSSTSELGIIVIAQLPKSELPAPQTHDLLCRSEPLTASS